MASAGCAVLVAGGGPAGLAAAIALAERGVTVTVLEPSAGPATPRAEMLPRSARAIMARLGQAEIYARSRALMPALSLWSSPTPTYLGHGLEIEPTAIGVDRQALDRAMRAHAVGLGVRVDPCRLVKVEGRPGAWTVGATGPDGAVDFEARFVMDATGRRAALARRFGARLSLGPALIARTCRVESGVPDRLVIEATDRGWWYALPLPGGGGTLGFVSAPGAPVAPATLLSVPPEVDWLDAARWDARLSRLWPMGGEGWLAIGDAGAAFDPIAAQGLFNALSGGFLAGNAVADTLAGRSDGRDVFCRLAARTAERTHAATPAHYAAVPRDGAFWRRQRQSSDLFSRADTPPRERWRPADGPDRTLEEVGGRHG